MTSQEQPGGGPEPMTIAVIGATGFVGSSVVPRLARGGHRVVAVSRDGGRQSGWPDSVEARSADVATGVGLSAALQGAEAVVHLVAIPRESDGRTFDGINVAGTRHVVETSRVAGVRRFVHLSALGVIDNPRLDYLYSGWGSRSCATATSVRSCCGRRSSSAPGTGSSAWCGPR